MFSECLLITRRIVIKKSICMILFHVVQQGYTVRLNTGGIPFQKINCCIACNSQSFHTESFYVVHTVNSVLALSNSIDF